MARPDVYPITEDAYEAVGPLAVHDPDLDWPLLKFANVLMGLGPAQVDSYVAEREDGEGWAQLFSPSETPAEVLPYLGQFVGVRLYEGDTEAQRRVKVTSPEGWRRGSVESMVAAVQRTLTGSKQVYVEERFGGNAYQMYVRTLASETPVDTLVARQLHVHTANLTPTEAAIVSQKPIGIVLTYQSITGQTWDDLVADHATWNAVVGDYATWTEAVNDLP